MSEPIGDLINSLGVTHKPAPGELVSDAIVLLKVVRPDDGVTLRTASSPRMSWIEKVGMFRVAERSELDDLSDESAD